MKIHLYNTAGREKQVFKTIKDGVVNMYNCGPTVYNYAHIGNLRAFVFADVLRRTLKYSGLKVNQVINITDVGHLTSDADDGEDKLEKGARREGKSAKEIALFYEKAFFNDIKALNIKTEGTIFPRATEHIPQQIELIQRLEKKGFTYKITDGIYFDTSKYNDYGKLALLNTSALKSGARVKTNTEKKNHTDFALWKFSSIDVTTNLKRQQEWNSPWGLGFPGWHIECSAMAMHYLGETLDIHTGGIDHIPVHHSNEIAQSECATGKTFAKFWLHSEFVTIEGSKMAKSEENFLRLQSIVDKKIAPASFRYWLLQAHYRTPLSFSWDALHSAQTALMRALLQYTRLGNDFGEPSKEYITKFEDAIADDLNTPKVLALVAMILKDDAILDKQKRATLEVYDSVLGLGFNKTANDTIKKYSNEVEFKNLPAEVIKLAKERKTARSKKDWQTSDTLRDEIKKLGYDIDDNSGGQIFSEILD